MPKRIQRKRTKGWKMPDGAVYVGRPTKWGNPFKREANLHHFETLILNGGIDCSELRGKDLACWCPLDQPCHADVLLQVANA